MKFHDRKTKGIAIQTKENYSAGLPEKEKGKAFLSSLGWPLLSLEGQYYYAFPLTLILKLNIDKLLK